MKTVKADFILIIKFTKKLMIKNNKNEKQGRIIKNTPT